MRKDGYVARPLHQRLIAGVLAALMGIFPIMTPVYAASYSVPTLLADTPINTKNQAKPNIILTVDDSTSMLYDFLPDYVVSTYCRDGTGMMNSPCGYAGSPGSAGPGGQYVSPQYVWEQPNSVYLKSVFGATAGVALPFPATGTGAGAVPPAFSPQLFSDSGPGAGCNFTATPPSCTGGIDPGPLPGIWSYAPASGSPQAGLPYEYWQLWPAPAHNSSLNHVYYDPRLQYDPPAYPDGASYPQMTSANTAGWTQVPANPFLTAGKPLDCTTAPCVDLTQKVMVGQWCNSDWTQGLEDDGATPFVTDPGHCRVNGLVAAASAGAPAATGDYLYPWAPTGITPNLFATSGGVSSSKVNIGAESIAPPTNASIQPAWATAQDAKFFYENENVLWCDVTSPDWPQTGPTVPQTCTNKITPQTCTPNPVQPTCSGSVPGTCGGAIAAGTCSATASGNCAGYLANGVCTGALANGQCTGYAANGQCTGYAANGKCTGWINGVCSATATGNCSGFSNGVCTGFSNGVCGGGAAAACNNAPTCGGAGPAACAGQTKEACVAGTAANCGGLVGQTCSGPTAIACNPVAQTCNGGGAQNCANITKHDPDPSLCTSAWVPAGCNINPDPEATCVYTTTCPPPTFTGFCSIQTTKVCASDTDCPFVNGSCSITSASCAINTDCNLKRCQGTLTDCTANAAICGNVAGSGKCSITNASCTVDTDCPAQGTCNYKTTGGVLNGVCTSSAGCQPFPNHCAVTVATTCPVVGANSASCPTGVNSGTCNYQNNAGTANGPCTLNTDCKAKPNVCNNPAGLACPGGVANCTQGTCNYQNNAGTANGPCAVVGDCKAKPNTCTNAGATLGTVCASAAACTDNGHCTNAGATNGSVCTTAAACTDNGTCTTGNVGASCTAVGATAQCALITGKCTAGDPALINTACTANAQCTKNGACSTGNIGAVCTSASNTDVACKKNGACTTGSIGTVCTTNSATDVACKKSGACTTGNIGAVCNSASATDVACAKAGACTTGSIGTSCSTTGAAAAADPACAKAGSCTSGNVGASCTAVGNTAQCALATGVCSNNANTCTLANASTQCAAVPGKCTAGLPNTTSCTVNSDCDKGSVCSNSASNGAACATPANCTPLNGSCSFDTTIACTTNAQCTNLVGQCSSTGAACTLDSQCPNVAGPLPPSTARCDTVGISGNNALTLLNDADTNGKACRRNNHAYADGTTASQFNYPSGKFTTPVTGAISPATGRTACQATNHFTTVPRHYWVTEVEWCDKAIGSPADRWLGYGTPDVLYCIESHDASHPYPRFYQFGGTPTIDPATGLPTNGGKAGTQNDPAVDPLAPPAFARIDLDTSNPGATYTAAPEYGSGLSAVTRNFGGNTPDVSEMVNYANWFAYYRTRILAVKTVTSLAFLGKSFGTFNVDDSYRVGFHTLFNPKGSFVDIADFDSTQKPLWATQMFGINIPLGQETPTLDAMARIGDYFLNGGSAELAGSSDPIILSCQKNWHMLFTDGFTNQGAPKASAGDQDKLVPAYPDNATNPIPGLVPGNNWPAPLSEDLAKPVSDALADFAMQYWVTDLRTVGPNAVNNVPSTQTDPASWQHLNFAALALGTAGTLPSNAFDNPPYPAWPKPSPVNKPGAAGVDDLWHAATSARGAFVNAQSADEVKLGMGSILADIANQKGARASAGFQNSNIAGTNNFIYRALFQPGWYGTLTKITIDPVTGTEGAQVWEAADQLQAQLTVIPGVKDTPWFTERNIATMDATGTPVPFLWGSLSSVPVDQQDSLAPGKPARSKRVLEWIRGSTQFEGKKVGQFRSRLHAPLGEQFLGDIVDSKPVYVGPPNKGYLEQSNLGYTAFTFKWTTTSPRPPMVYVGANDGMVHAIDDATGNEKMAYVPSPLYRGDATGVGALTYQDGALPPFTHHYLVDSTPKAWDVDFGGPDWHTVLVGGLGKGGMAYYALDITDPASITSEATAVKKVLWEFTNQTAGVKGNLGYTYGQATIVKTHATKGGFTSGQWVAIVPSGYDNTTGSGDGKGHIFFVDIKTGKLLKEMSTGFGDTSAPSGLAQIAGYTKDRRNQVVEQVYGGDLYGNFWRFDVHDPDPANWVVEKLATLVDGGGVPQPVTIAPQIEIDVQNGVDRWVFIGTGRLLDDTDLAVSQQQTLYAIRDGDLNNPLPAVNQPTGIVPRTDMVLLADRIAGLSGKPDIGWFDDLPADQRIVTPIQADISVVAYIGTSPQTDPCLLGQPATVYARGFAQGESLLTDVGGNPVAGIDEPEGGVGLQLVQLEPEPNSTLYNIQIAVTLGTGKTIFIKPTLPTYLISHRMSWRLLNQ